MKEIFETAPTNELGGGFSVSSASSNPNPNMAGFDPPLGKVVKRKRKKFAGVEIFPVTTEEFMKCAHGRQKYERWGKKMNMEDINNKDIRKYAHTNPGKSIIIQDQKSGVMSYLINPPFQMNENENKKEEIVMSMKRDKDDLRKRYGDRWKSVMYATANKLAKK